MGTLVNETTGETKTFEPFKEFMLSILEDGGVTATVRRTLGSDIDASCGQLRRKYTRQQVGADEEQRK